MRVELQADRKDELMENKLTFELTVNEMVQFLKYLNDRVIVNVTLEEGGEDNDGTERDPQA